LPEVLETTETERLATGFIFTEGPLWHPDGYWYFVDLRCNQLLRLTPGKEPELVRTTTGGNGTTFDLQGRLIVCEGDDRRLTRMGPDSKIESLVDSYQGGRFNRPNDVICHSNGCLYFTDPDALGRLIPARTDAGFAHLLSYSRVVGDVEITRSPIIAWWFPPDGSVWPLPVTPDFTVLDRDDFTVVHRDDFTVSDKTFRWVLTEEPNGGFKGSNGGFYNSVDEAKAELLAVGLRNDPPR
jgi:hypothetical protein